MPTGRLHGSFIINYRLSYVTDHKPRNLESCFGCCKMNQLKSVLDFHAIDGYQEIKMMVALRDF